MDMMVMLDGKLERDQTGRASCPQHGYKFWLSIPGWTEDTGAMFFLFLLFFFFLINVALFFSIVFLAGTLPPAPLSVVCVCPCNRL